MCVRAFNIKSRSVYGIKKAFVPCGKCEECRQSLKNQWAFRLRTELLYCQRQNWHVGFFTLTYNDEHLPLLPPECIRFDAVTESCPAVPCFSRHDVRTFIDNIRKRLNERYGLGGNSRVRYLIACEYGSSTKRPHMHGLICFPPQVPPQEVYELIKSNWTDKGFVFPRTIRGGIDSHGYRHKPFLLQGDIAGAAVYASKYCCKDLDFYESLKDFDIDQSSVAFKDCKPFHIQSRSIGLQFFQTKDTSELLDCLRNGESFVGSTKRIPLPLYIKNKILYTPKYSFEPSPVGDWWYDFEADKWRYKKGQGTHRRIVEREALDFFKENVHQVFSQKVEYYKSLFGDMLSLDFWTTRKVSKFKAAQFVSMAEDMAQTFGFDSERLAVGYITYYGVPYEKCVAVPPEKFYLARYDSRLKWKKKQLLIHEGYYKNLHHYLGFLFDALKFACTTDNAKRKRIARIIDMYKSIA